MIYPEMCSINPLSDSQDKLTQVSLIMTETIKPKHEKSIKGSAEGQIVLLKRRNEFLHFPTVPFT